MQSTNLFEFNEVKHIYPNTEHQNYMVRALTLFICQRSTNCNLRSCDIPSQQSRFNYIYTYIHDSVVVPAIIGSLTFEIGSQYLLPLYLP